MNLVSDARHAVRYLLAAPGYSLAAVATLALAFAANSAVFGVVQAVLLKPTPVRQPSDLVVAWQTDRANRAAVVEVSYSTFERWARATSFSEAAAMGSSLWPAVLRGQGEPARVSTAGVSSSFFKTLGVAPLLGRLLDASDDVPNAPSVAVLSHSTWVRRFGSDRNVVGRLVQLDRARQIVGVMPPDFEIPRAAEFWIPVKPILEAAAQPGINPLEDVGVLVFVGRLRDGTSRALALSELGTLVRAPDRPSTAGREVALVPLLDYVLGPVRESMWIVWAAVVVLLLIACANVSGLMLTRAALRTQEHAVRIALGGTSWNIARMWLLEAGGLVIAGAAVGWLVGGLLLKAIVLLAPDDIPRLSSSAINPVVGLFTLGAVVIVAVLCGAGPIRQALSTSIVVSLGNSARVTPGRRPIQARSLLVTVQIALAFVLLVTAGLVARSFAALRQLDVGFESSDVVTMFVQAPSNPWMSELLMRLQASHEVRSAGAIYLRPLELGPIGEDAAVVLEGQPDTARTRRDNPTLNYQVATPGFFDALRIRLIHGRFFASTDGPQSSRVVLVSESAARRLWPGQSALGRKILLPTVSSTSPGQAWRTVVGVVGDVHYRGLGDVRLDVYDPALQAPSVASYVTVRAADNPISAVSLVRAEVRRLDPNVVVDGVALLDAVVARARAPWQFGTWMLALFAAFGFLLAAIGLFSVVALDVANRRHELAVRSALGATPAHLLIAVLLPAAGRVVAGVAVGAAGAAVAARGIETLLFRISSLDPLTWCSVFALVVGTVALSAYLPARRGCRLDPLALLRRG